MERLEGWLKAHPLVLSLILAGVAVGALALAGIFSENVMPFGDGEHYLLRGFRLYGYLHTAQWASFWDLFTLPRQSIAPPHYWIFFLLPKSIAGITSYGLVQAICTYGLMACGVWGLCRALARPAWAPAIFILCATQNVALDYSYFYFVDLAYFACGIVVLALQVNAWRTPSWKMSLLSGCGAGFLFWVKPGNAVLFTATYGLAEVIRLGVLWCQAGPAGWKPVPRHVAGIVAGFLPVTALALACGALSSILRVADANEASAFFATHLNCTGLARFFYFPLCLSFYYHVGLLGIIATLVWGARQLVGKVEPDTAPETEGTSFSGALFLPILIAYLIFGEFFSFGLSTKTMRSLLMILPVLWIAIFWLVERWRVGPGTLFLAAVAYAACGYAQIFNDAFGTRLANAESYQLKDNWLSQMPPRQTVTSDGVTLTRGLMATIRQHLPEGGKVAVGTEQIFLTSESLTWVAQHELALEGKSSPYEFRNFLSAEGGYARSSLLGARAILLIVSPVFQYSDKVLDASRDFSQFGLDQWKGKDHYAEVIAFQGHDANAFGYLIVTKTPLDDAHISEAIDGTHALELPGQNEFNVLPDRRLTWAECWEILFRFKQKRLQN